MGSLQRFLKQQQQHVQAKEDDGIVVCYTSDEDQSKDTHDQQQHDQDKAAAGQHRTGRRTAKESTPKMDTAPSGKGGQDKTTTTPFQTASVAGSMDAGRAKLADIYQGRPAPMPFRGSAKKHTQLGVEGNPAAGLAARLLGFKQDRSTGNGQQAGRASNIMDSLRPAEPAEKGTEAGAGVMLAIANTLTKQAVEHTFDSNKHERAGTIDDALMLAGAPQEADKQAHTPSGMAAVMKPPLRHAASPMASVTVENLSQFTAAELRMKMLWLIPITQLQQLHDAAIAETEHLSAATVTLLSAVTSDCWDIEDAYAAATEVIAAAQSQVMAQLQGKPMAAVFADKASKQLDELLKGLSEERDRLLDSPRGHQQRQELQSTELQLAESKERTMVIQDALGLKQKAVTAAGATRSASLVAGSGASLGTPAAAADGRAQSAAVGHAVIAAASPLKGIANSNIGDEDAVMSAPPAKVQRTWSWLSRKRHRA